MEGRFEIELEPEVQQWLDALSADHYLRVMRLADFLADQAETLGEPWTRRLGGPVRELRFTLERRDWRITYWLAPDHRLVMLTVFHKTKMRETTQVDRARRAQAHCQAHHRAAQHVYDRPIKEEEL